MRLFAYTSLPLRIITLRRCPSISRTVALTSGYAVRTYTSGASQVKTPLLEDGPGYEATEAELETTSQQAHGPDTGGARSKHHRKQAKKNDDTTPVPKAVRDRKIAVETQGDPHSPEGPTPVIKLTRDEESLVEQLEATYRANPRSRLRRVQVVSGGLCDDIISRLSPSLSQHEGCDIIDLNPGVGLWSAKVHERLKPRSHILVEDKMYLPFLRPLLDQPNSRYKHVPLDGGELRAIDALINDGHLPGQPAFGADDRRRGQPNHTLLVLVGLTAHPPRPLGEMHGSEQLAIEAFLHALQFRTALRTRGRVRMLLWLPDRYAPTLLPKLIHRRPASSVYAEGWLRHVHQVAAAELARPPPGYCRGRGWRYRSAELSVLSAMRAVRHMAQGGVATPAHRKGRVQRVAEAAVAAGGAAPASSLLLLRDPAETWWYPELRALDESYRRGEIVEREKGTYRRYTPLFARYQRLLSFEKRHHVVSEQLRALVRAAHEEMGDGAAAAAAAAGAGGVDAAGVGALFAQGGVTAAYVTAKKRTRPSRPKSPGLPDALKQQVDLYLDDRAGLLSEPPLLLWDRRPYEPLLVQLNEFWPNRPITLLDLHPRSAEDNDTAINAAGTTTGDNSNSSSPAAAEVLAASGPDSSTSADTRPNLGSHNAPAAPANTNTDADASTSAIPDTSIAPHTSSPDAGSVSVSGASAASSPSPSPPPLPDEEAMLRWFLRVVMRVPKRPLPDVLRALGDGAADALLPHVPALRDPARGGQRDVRRLRARMLRYEHARALIRAWYRWPWRPTHSERPDMP